jgi:hypothetical protein
MKAALIEQTGQPSLDWNQIQWGGVERTVRRLQERIYRATQRQDWRAVRSLQKLLARATSNKLLAIRRVTQETTWRRSIRTVIISGIVEGVNGAQGLSRMSRKAPVRFLGEGAVVTPPPYPTL